MNFDAAYYRRYYEDPRTRVIEPDAVARTVDFLCAYLAYLEVEVRSIVDLGCGTGAFRAPFAARLPEAVYEGVEASGYACERFGWTHASADRFRPAYRYDLVVCYDVLQYLDDRAADQAIDNFAALTSGALFFGVLTRSDWDPACDRTRTDGDVYLREGDWYRTRLAPHFRNLGGGIFLPRDSGVIAYDLETLPE